MAAVSPYPSEQSHFWEVSSQVSTGLPDQLQSPLAWTRDEVEDKRSHWIVKLEQPEVAAVERALAAFEAKSLDLSKISKDTFVLPPSLAWRLKQISYQCYQGIGFAVVRGLESSNYTPKQNVIIYAGISSYVGPQRGYQDRKHEKVLGHMNHADKSFHSDGAEILAYHALNLQPSAGKALISSSWQIYNELANKSETDIQELAKSNHIPLPLIEGDIAYINDMAMFHALESADEGDRHLVRLYLRDPEQDWAVPEMMAENWEEIYGPVPNEKTRVENWGV
jgi:hypothetical protein